MPSLNRRVAARRLAWGTGPHLLTFAPAASPSRARQAEAEIAPEAEPVPSLTLRFADEFEGSREGCELAAPPTIDPAQAPAPLAVIHADGSRDRCESAEADYEGWSSGRSWVRLRPHASHLRVYAGEGHGLALRQA